MRSFINDFLSAYAEFKIEKNSIFLIGGPCVIESEKMCLQIASEIKDVCDSLHIPFIFKASFDKANRTSVNSFRGPGIKEGLKILKVVKKKLSVPVVSDIHNASQAQMASKILDVIQIPALLARQTDILIAAGKTKKIVNVKKGQFMAPGDMINVVKKIASTGNEKILLTERGASFGYNNLVSDMRAIPIMKKFSYPVVFDGTHSVQLPSAGNGKSAGERQFVEPLSLAAIAAGCNGLFLEIHKNPNKALCDGPNMIDLKMLEKLLIKAKKIREIVK